MAFPRSVVRPLIATAIAAAIAVVLPLVAMRPAGAAVDCGGISETKAKFVCNSYASFLDRTPSIVEEEYWVAQLPARKTVMLAALARSNESLDRVIGAYYLTYGGYPVDPGSLAYWRGEVLKPNGFRRLQAGLLGSYVGMIDGFLDKAFGTVLGRDATPSERDYWGTRVVATSRTLVAADLIYTLEARRKTVTWAYYNELYVDVDAGSRDYWAGRLRSGFSYLDLRIALKSAGYPSGSGACSALTPPIGPTPGCET